MASVISVRVRVNHGSRNDPGTQRPATTASSTATTPKIDPRWMARG
jgi:hypothetical protein